jgi:hypothetical protein
MSKNMIPHSEKHLYLFARSLAAGFDCFNKSMIVPG